MQICVFLKKYSAPTDFILTKSSLQNHVLFFPTQPETNCILPLMPHPLCAIAITLDVKSMLIISSFKFCFYLFNERKLKHVSYS